MAAPFKNIFYSFCYAITYSLKYIIITQQQCFFLDFLF